MKRNLLVTLANENYIDQAKQLFSSVYWNAGWKWDYMLLAHEIPEKELKWFKDKGILIKKCKINKKIRKNSLTKLCKFYLFTLQFKKWNNIIYLDADIIVRDSLDKLTKIQGFAAVPDISNPKLANQFIKPKDEKSKRAINKLKKYYNLKETIFNSGIISFSTDIIKENTFSKLKKIFKLCKKIRHIVVDQLVFNLLFYKKWIKLPLVYNIYVLHMIDLLEIKPEKIKGIILHFIRYKPWDKKNYFYKEWKHNLKKAELIDLKKIPFSQKKWTKQEIQRYDLYLKIRVFIDRNLGLMGIFLKHNFPKLYYIIKNLKNKKYKNN